MRLQVLRLFLDPDFYLCFIIVLTGLGCGDIDGRDWQIANYSTPDEITPIAMNIALHSTLILYFVGVG